MPHLSDKEFLNYLRENAGIPERTARKIREATGKPYSRQAAQKRIGNFPKELEDIQEQNIDVATEGLMSLMRSKDERIRLAAIKYFLDAKARHQGFGQKIEIATKGNPFLELSSEERAEILKVEAAQIEMNKLNGPD